MNKKRFHLLLLVLPFCAFVALIIFSGSLDTINNQKNAAGEIESIQILNIRYMIPTYLLAVPLFLFGFLFWFYPIRFLLKTAYSFLKNHYSHTIAQILLSLGKINIFRLPFKESLKKSLSLLFYLIAPFSFIFFYENSYKTDIVFKKSPSNELTICSYFLYPKKTRVHNVHLNSSDSLRVHLWTPTINDQGIPIGQIDLFQKNINKEDDPSKGQVILREGTNRIELFTGHPDISAKLGMLLYEMTGLSTTVDHVYGNDTHPSSHKVFPAKLFKNE